MYGSVSSSDESEKKKRESDALLLSTRRHSTVNKRRHFWKPTSVLHRVFSNSVSAVQSNGKSHSFVYTLLNPRSRQWQAVAYKSFISTIIITDLTAFIISTDVTMLKEYQMQLYAMEGLVSSIFLIEYVARMVTITERKSFGELGPILGRLSYAITWGAIIDFTATAPFFVEILTGWNLPTMTHLRFFRLFRILKTEGYVRAMDAVYRVIYYNRQILYVALLVCCFLVLLTAVLLYYLRPPYDPENAESFSSILATLYIATMMLTGQGGPEGELPWYTKCIVLLTSVFSVAMFAIPASMLTWGFEAEASRCAKKSWKKHKKTSNDAFSTCSSSEARSSDNSTDEEYFKIIAGEEETDDEGSAEKAWLQEQKALFRKADSDNSGTISLQEYIQMKKDENDSGIDSEISLRSRVEAIEEKLDENDKKLDLILKILQDSKVKFN